MYDHKLNKVGNTIINKLNPALNSNQENAFVIFANKFVTKFTKVVN